VGLGYDRHMSVRKYLALPLLIAVVGVIYYWLSYEWIGTVLLIVFAGAMAVMGWILIPTLNDAGPTAPIDPDFEYPGRR
jgi:NADH:ubiquinone oxidoreductase subunit 6 (subunit J)